MALNAKLRSDDGSERQTVRRTNLNIKQMTTDGSERQTEDVALNAEMKMRL